MARSYRRTSGRTELDAYWLELLCLRLLMMFGCTGSPAIGNGTTAGKLRTTATAAGRAAGVDVSKASADDLWDLSAETDTIAAQYRAYWLYLNASGTASIVAGSNAASAALALAALPDPSATLAIWGVFVAGPSTDFNAGGGLAAQGTIYNGIPAGVPIRMVGQTYVAPTLVNITKF